MPSKLNTSAHTIKDLVPVSNLSFQWGDRNSHEFIQEIELTYKETVYWKQNIFKVPSVRAGKLFVCELSRIIRACFALEGIAMKAAMVMPALLLQKPHPKSMTKDHTDHLARQRQRVM